MALGPIAEPNWSNLDYPYDPRPAEGPGIAAGTSLALLTNSTCVRDSTVKFARLTSILFCIRDIRDSTIKFANVGDFIVYGPETYVVTRQASRNANFAINKPRTEALRDVIVVRRLGHLIPMILVLLDLHTGVHQSGKILVRHPSRYQVTVNNYG